MPVKAGPDGRDGGQQQQQLLHRHGSYDDDQTESDRQPTVNGQGDVTPTVTRSHTSTPVQDTSRDPQRDGVPNGTAHAPSSSNLITEQGGACTDPIPSELAADHGHIDAGLSSADLTSSVREHAEREEHEQHTDTPATATSTAKAEAAQLFEQPTMTTNKQDLPASSSMLNDADAHHDRSTAESRPTPGRLSELKRFTLWETRTHFYLVAYNTSQTLFRILKVDRVPETRSHVKQTGLATGTEAEAGGSSKVDGESATEGSTLASTTWSLNVTADKVVYTRGQISELLDMVSEGNRSTGGLKEVGRFFGIVGFIRFTSTYYMVLISRRSVVGLLGGHYIYHCDETKIIPVCPPSVLANLTGRTKAMDQEEARLLHTFKQVDLSKNFYFSYTYDLTKTLQDNLTQVDAAERGSPVRHQTAWGYSEKFIWNHHLLLPAFATSEHRPDADSSSEWVLPLVYGFVDQAKLRVLNCTIHVTLIARRSRHFAGARFLKRGTNEKGHVANDVETEQIVSDALTTPFYAPKARRGGNRQSDAQGGRGPNPRYTSYVMHRGSIPVFWTQDSTNMSPRPPIEISVVDPFYSSAALHFDDMLRRYGHPIVVLNLIKSKEKQPREVKLLNAFGECVRYLNQFLPSEKRLHYIAWDMSRASKSRDQDVIGVLEDIAEETINATKFFHSGPEPNKFGFKRNEDGTRPPVRDSILLQSGVARVNCVDCLDRTNAAQFVIGKAAFGHQLYALGLLSHPGLPFDSDAIDMLTEMYHDLGDTIALQYGGSHLVNTMETYRKINQWTSHSRDMLEGLKRYYSNSFVDAEKQAAINLFLGVDNDAPDFRPVDPNKRRHYQQWYTPEHLEPRGTVAERQELLQQVAEAASSFWAEYYRPSLFTDLMRHHAFKMTAIHQQSATPPVISHLPNSPPVGRRASALSLSPPVLAPSSPGSKLGRLRANSAQQAETTISPFTSRVPLASSEGSVHSPQIGPPRPQQKAIIGGVRRWMSLNRGEEDAVGFSSTSARKVSSKRTADPAVESGGEEATANANPSGMAAFSGGTSAWPTWDEITGATVAAPTTGFLLNGLMDPTVSVEEVKEYASWLDQFRDVSFEEVPQDAIPEPAALLPASHVQQASNAYTHSGVPHSGFVSHRLGKTVDVEPAGGGGLATLAPSALIAPQQLQSIGVRRPATQKQRQQIAEADARLYDRDVALAAGYYGILGSGTSVTTGLPATDGGGGSGVEEKGVEAALLHYPLSTNVLQAPPSDAKVRAYTQWLHGHSRSLPVVAAERISG